MIETAATLIVLADASGRILLFNRACEELTGYDRSEVLGKTIGELFLAPEWQEVVEKRFANLDSPEVREPHENPWLSRSGEEIWIEWRCVPLHFGEDNPYLLGTGQDISDRERVAEAMQRAESEGRLRAAMEASLDGVYFLKSVRDPQGEITDFEFFEVNARGEEMVMLSREKLIGKRLCELFPINVSGGFFERYKGVVETGQPLQEEFQSYEDYFKPKWAQHQVVKLHDGIVINTRDITERKLAEEALCRLPHQIFEAQELERKRIAQNLHDGLVQVLASIGFRLRGVEDKLQTCDPALAQEVASARKALSEASKEARGSAHQLHPIHLENLGLKTALREAKHEFQERTGLTVTLSTSRMLDHSPAQTQVHLYRIVLAALANVEKHAKARRVSIRISIRAGKVFLQISDDGRGMALESKQVQRRIAAGHGLAGIQKSAQLLGGHMHLDTRKGKGTKLSIEVPNRPQFTVSQP